VLITFIGPWNEFLWPFLVTKRADMQPLAVSLANCISNVANSTADPFGALLAGGSCWPRRGWCCSSRSSDTS
jgi:multiple sugar transport system permease protein